LGKYGLEQVFDFSGKERPQAEEGEEHRGGRVRVDARQAARAGTGCLPVRKNIKSAFSYNIAGCCCCLPAVSFLMCSFFMAICGLLTIAFFLLLLVSVKCCDALLLMFLFLMCIKLRGMARRPSRLGFNFCLYAYALFMILPFRHSNS
jgi:hypothetical protein